MKLLTTNEKILNFLEKNNIKDSENLLEYLPYRYEDYSYSDEDNINDKDKVTLLIKLISNVASLRVNNLDILRFHFISLKTNRLYKAVCFNRAFYKKMLNLSDEFTLVATFNKNKNEFNIINIYKGVIEENKKFKPVYHLNNNISQNLYKNLLIKTFSKYRNIYSYDIPSFFIKKYKLLRRIEALEKVHFPNTFNDISIGLRTLKYNECLEFNLKNAIIRYENNKVVIGKNKVNNLKDINQFILNLKYKLTHDQIKCIRDIVLDMNKDKLMYRLLEGDVGTGKTIVAITSLYANFLRHNIGAFMVPTDTLARQQYQELQEVFKDYNIKVELLIGSLTLKEKRIIKEKLKNNEIDIICGTHALFSDDVIYPNLGLCIIDEQHRFGVNQRSALVSKGELCDLLLMSATPIPRTLSMALYGDLDISTLNEYPTKKEKVETYVINEKNPLIFQIINEMLSENRQIFILAPKIEDDSSSYSVDKLYAFFSSIYKDKVLSLSSKNKSEEKNEIIRLFKEKEKLILVSTTVVELGLNVLDAGAMLIYSASHFGLASLHQLRGRVGRNGKNAYCLLIDEEDNERLKLLESIYDGATLALEDLKIRGSGDFIGIRQSGFSSFRTVNIIDDNKMFLCAKEDAFYIMNHLDELEFEKYVLRVKSKMKKEEKELFLLES